MDGHGIRLVYQRTIICLESLKGRGKEEQIKLLSTSYCLIEHCPENYNATNTE